MNQSELEMKYSIQQWRERTNTVLSHHEGIKELIAHMAINIERLVINQLNHDYHKGVQWNTFDMSSSYKLAMDSFIVLVEGMLRHVKYTNYIPYTAVMPGLIVTCKKYQVGEDVAKAAFDLIFIMDKTITGVWYTHGYTPYDNQGAIFMDEDSINFLKGLGLYEDLSQTVKSLPPMVELPKKWRKNMDGGYLHHKAKLAKDDEANEALAEYANAIQEQPYQLNSKMLEEFNLVEFLQTKLPHNKAIRLTHRVNGMTEELVNRNIYMIPFFDGSKRQYYYGWEHNFQGNPLNKASIELSTALPME